MRRLTVILGLTWLALGAYALAYAAARGSHLLVHTALWTSEEGLDGHHVHDVVSEEPLVLRAFAPLAWCEVQLRGLLQ
ncbi:MAG: hypothetical protein IAE78_33505 [Myxococcus sp.]|nr:hypothetical protein [Myxococcus sp.]